VTGQSHTAPTALRRHQALARHGGGMARARRTGPPARPHPSRDAVIYMLNKLVIEPAQVGPFHYREGTSGTA